MIKYLTNIGGKQIDGLCMNGFSFLFSVCLSVSLYVTFSYSFSIFVPLSCDWQQCAQNIKQPSTTHPLNLNVFFRNIWCSALWIFQYHIIFNLHIFAIFPLLNLIFKLHGTALYFSLNTCLKQILFKSVFSILIKISKTFHLQKNSGDLNSEHLYSGNIWITNFYLFAIQMLANSSLFKPWTKSLLFKPCKVSDMNTLVDS